MKALSVKQPWASWIVSGRTNALGVREFKTIETRTWETKYRGPLLICASKKPDAWAIPIAFGKNKSTYFGPLGVALGVARLVDCRPMTEADADAAFCLPRRDGTTWAWVLEGPLPLKAPFPVEGRLGLFDVDTADQGFEVRA